MQSCAPNRHPRSAARLGVLGGVLALSLTGAMATAASPGLRYAGEIVHPACVHALAMQHPDAIPVTMSVNLEGCSASARSKSSVSQDGEFAVFEDEDLLAGGSFGYRELTQLDNGIIGLVVRRTDPDGEEHVSLAAVELVVRPMVRQGRIVQAEMLELLGEIWIPDMQIWSFRSVGNLVHFEAGAGPDKVERTFDFTELGKKRK
jgi:hypothetical protein